MARLLSISLLLLFLGNIIGGISFLLIKQLQRHEHVESLIKSGVYNQSLTQIHFEADQLNEIKWVEHEREFRYKGDLYDVVRLETTPEGGKIFHCIADHEETKLIAEIERNLGNGSNGHHDDQMIVLQLFKFVAEFHFAEARTQVPHVCIINKCSTNYICSILNVTLSCPAQPPDIA